MDYLFLDDFIEKISKPIIEEEYIQEDHLILSKYTSKKYYKYSVELIKTLLEKSNYENKRYIFHMSLYYLLKILYNFKNTPYIDNYDLLILCSFSLGIKVTVDQHKTPFITKLKNIYPEKYSSYTNNEIQKCEVICLKLLNYKINILTSYEILLYFFKNNKNKLPFLLTELEKKILNNVEEILFKNPYDLAKEIICKNSNEIKEQPLLITKKVIPAKYSKNKKIISETASTMSVSSSYGSLKEAMNNFSYNKILKELKNQSNLFNCTDIKESSFKEINNKNKLKIINIKYKYNYSSQNPINKKLKKTDVKKIIHKKNIYDSCKKLYNDEEKIHKLNKYAKCVNASSDLNELNISSSTLSNNNHLSRNSKIENSNKFLCFSDRKSIMKISKYPQNLKCNSHINIIEKDNNYINNSNVKKNLRNSIFKKPILNKNDVLTSFTMKDNIRNNIKMKKINYNNNISIKNFNTSNNYKIQI